MRASRSLIFFVAALLVAGSAWAATDLRVVTNDAGGGNAACQAQPGGCELDATCVQEGEYAMRVRATPTAGAASVQADSSVGFNDETVFRASFWFDPDDMDIRHGWRHFLLSGVPGAGVGVQAPFRVAFFKNAFTGDRKIAANCKVNCATPGTCASAATTKINLGPSPGYTQLVFEWKQNTGPGILDGLCKITAVGVGSSEANITNLQYTIGAVKMGLLGGAVIDPQASGDHCFDDFQSFRTLAPE